MAMKPKHSNVHQDVRSMPKGQSSKEEPRMGGMNMANHHNGMHATKSGGMGRGDCDKK